MSSHLSDDLQEQYEDFRMLVRKATKETLDEPDWAVNTDCVNLVKPITDPDLLYEIAQLLMRRLREGNIRIVVLTLYLIDALAHHCGHALLLTFNDEQFMQQIASVARKYHLSPSQRAISMPEDHPARAEAVSVCVELLNNWSEFFRARRAYYSNIVDMAEILESEGIGKPGNVRASSPSSPSVAASQGYTTLASGADQSRRTQQVSSPLTAHNTSSGNMLSDISLTTNDKSMMYPTTTTTTNNNNTISGANANNSTSNNPVAAPLASIHEHSKAHSQSPPKPQLTTTLPSNGSPPKPSNSFKSDHPWFSREDRGMQSKSDYSKTTLDSHEPRDRFDSDDYNNNNVVAPYSPERAEAKNKASCSTTTTAQEQKNSSYKLPIPATSSSNTNTATAIFSPLKTVTRSGSGEGENEDDFGVGGDLWDDSMEMSPSVNTESKGLNTMHTSTSAKLSPSKRPHPIVIGSPQKPAQKALQEFLETNTIEDRELQEELLNQVEIEKRIQENNRSKQALQSNNNLNSSSNVYQNNTNTNTSTHHSTQQQQSTRTNQNTAMVKNTNYTPANTPINTVNVTNASTLQHELTHQHEIEQSIREQMKNKQHNSSHTNNNYNNSVYSNTNTKTHYSKTTNSKVNTHMNSTAKSPILEDIRNFQYSFDSNEQMVYNTDIMHSQSYDNAQVPPRSPHKREQVSSLHYPPNSAVGLSRLDTDSDDNYDGNVIDYADGTNQDFFFVPSTNTYIDTMDRKNHHNNNNRPHTGSISSNDYYTGGSSVGGMSNVNSVHRNHGNMGNMGMGHPIHPMHPAVLNPINPTMNNGMNMYNLPGEFVSLTTTQYNFTKVPSFYSGMNMNVPAITNMNNNNIPMSTSPNYYGGSSVHSPQPHAYPNNTIHSPPTATTVNNDGMPVLNSQSNNSLLLDQQIEQQKLILQEFERQKQLLLLQQKQQQQNRLSPVHMQQSTSPRSTYTASPLPNAPDLQQEMDLAKERLLMQQQTILASAPAPAVVANVSKNNHVQSAPTTQSAPAVKETSHAVTTTGATTTATTAVDKVKPGATPPPVTTSSVSNSIQQRPRGVENLTLRTSSHHNMTNITDNNNNGPNGGNTSVYGNNNSVSGASNNGYSSLPSRKYSYGGSEHLAASRAAAGTPHSFAHTNDSLNPSLHAQRREKERREQRKREIESEWAREQERAMEHTNEHERTITNTNNTANSPLPGGGNIHTSRGGRRLNITTSTSITGNNNNDDLDDNTVVSDLTSSTISSTSRTLYSKIDAEPVAPPLSRSDSDIIRSMYVENHLSTSILPLRGISNKLNAESNNNLSSNNLSSTNTNTNTSAGVNTEDPVFQSVAKMLQQALDPADSAQMANPHNTSMNGGTIDRAKALAAAQLLIATLTGTPAVTTATTTASESNNVNGAYEGMIEKSSSHESSRPYALSIDVSDIAVARTPRNAYKHKASGNTNTTMSPKMEQYSTRAHRDIVPAVLGMQGINATASVELPMTSSGSAAGMPPRSPVKPTAIRSTSERYIVPDVISKQQPIPEEKFSPPRMNKSDSASISPVDTAAVYPTTTLTRNTVALQSGISVITDDDSYFTKERPNAQNTYNNLTSSHHHSAHERGRNRHRPPLNVGIGGMEPVSDTGKPVSSNRHSQRGLHRSASMEPSPRHSNSHTPTDFNTNTHSSNSAGKLSPTSDNTTRRLHRSASLEPSRSPRHSSRDSNKAVDHSVWQVDSHNSPKESAGLGYDRGSSSELHLSDPTSFLTEASGSPRYTTNSVPKDNRDNASTAFSQNEASRHSKQSAFDSASDSQANFVANAILQHRHKTSPRGHTGRSVERDTSRSSHVLNKGTSNGMDTNSMQGTTSSLMESSYAQDSHRTTHTTHTAHTAHSTSRSASHTDKDTKYVHSPGSVSNSQRGTYDSSHDRDHHSHSPLRASYDDHAPTHFKPRSSSKSRPRDPEYRETIYNNPDMDVELYRATTTKEERRLDRQRERERRDLEKARSDRRRDGDKSEAGKSEGGQDRRSGGTYVSRSRNNNRDERDRYESSEHYNSNRSRGGDKYEDYDINDHRSERHSVKAAAEDDRVSHSDREKVALKAREESYAEQYVQKSSSRDAREAYNNNNNNSTYDDRYNDHNAVPYSGTSVHSGRMANTTTRDRADSSMSVQSQGGKVSLVDLARTRDPNYKSERSSRPSSMSNRRIYEDDLNSRYNNSISPMNHPNASTSHNNNTSSYHADKMHSKSHSNLVSQSYDDRQHQHQHHMSKSNMSVGYVSSDRHSNNNRRSSHEPAPVHNSSSNRGDHGNHRSSRDFRESGNPHQLDARPSYEKDYPSQQSYIDDTNTTNSKRHSSRQMESYNHQAHSSSLREMTYGDSNNYPSHCGSGRPVSLHRSSSNKYESGDYAVREGATKHSMHHSSQRNNNHNGSDDDVTRLSRPIDPQYNAKANSTPTNISHNMQNQNHLPSNMRSSSTHSNSYNTNHQGINSESNHSTPTAVYANTKPSSSANMSKPSGTVNSTSAGDSRRKWVCNMCTLENPPDFLACDACGMLRAK